MGGQKGLEDMEVKVQMLQPSSDLMSESSVCKLAEIFSRDFRAVRAGNCICDESYEILYREFGCKRSPNGRVYSDLFRSNPHMVRGHVGIHIGLYWDIVLVPYEFAMKVLAFGALPRQINVIDEIG